MEYKSITANFSDNNQKVKLKSALKNKTGVTIQFCSDQINNGKDKNITNKETIK